MMHFVPSDLIDRLIYDIEMADEAGRQMAEGLTHFLSEYLNWEVKPLHIHAMRMMYKCALMVKTDEDNKVVRHDPLTIGFMRQVDKWKTILFKVVSLDDNAIYVWPDICHICDSWSLLSSGTGCCLNCDTD